jgi:hypothetical protein
MKGVFRMSSIDWRKLAISLAVFAVVTFASTSLAMADTATFQLNVPSSLPAGNYGTVSLLLNGNGSITVTVALASGAVINGGQDCSICFNSSLSPDPNINFSALTLNYGGVPGNTNIAPAALHGDGFGTYEYGVKYLGSTGGSCVNDVNPCQQTVTFTVSKVSGTFSSVFDLVQNSTGGGIASPFAVDLLANGQTGFVGTGTSAVPEPTTMLLLGSGLLGVGAELRRRFKKS